MALLHLVGIKGVIVVIVVAKAAKAILECALEIGLLFGKGFRRAGIGGGIVIVDIDIAAGEHHVALVVLEAHRLAHGGLLGGERLARLGELGFGEKVFGGIVHGGIARLDQRDGAEDLVVKRGGDELAVLVFGLVVAAVRVVIVAVGAVLVAH